MEEAPRIRPSTRYLWRVSGSNSLCDFQLYWRHVPKRPKEGWCYPPRTQNVWNTIRPPPPDYNLVWPIRSTQPTGRYSLRNSLSMNPARRGYRTGIPRASHFGFATAASHFKKQFLNCLEIQLSDDSTLRHPLSDISWHFSSHFLLFSILEFSSLIYADFLCTRAQGQPSVRVCVPNKCQ